MNTFARWTRGLSIALVLLVVPSLGADELTHFEAADLLAELNEARSALSDHQRHLDETKSCSPEGLLDVCRALSRIDRVRTRLLPRLAFVPDEAHRLLFEDPSFVAFAREKLGGMDALNDLSRALRVKLRLMQEGPWVVEDGSSLARMLRARVVRALRRLDTPADLPSLYGSVRFGPVEIETEEALAPGVAFVLRARVDATGAEGVGQPGGALEARGLDALELHGHVDRDDYFQSLDVVARGRVPWSFREGDVLRVRLRFVGYGDFLVEDGRILPPEMDRIVEIALPRGELRVSLGDPRQG